MRTIIAIFLLGLLPLCAHAQPNASFTSDKQGDCPPATVRFFNSSTGISASAKYKWDFGNGNSSVLKDPSAVFTAEGTYNVKLTVTDNGNTSERSSVITVYKKPVVAFTVQDDKICIPDAAVFNSTSTAGDGYISSCQWDFGDGQTDVSSSATMAHYYAFPQLATVSLTATNNFGCSQSLIKTKIVSVNPQLFPSFTADNKIFCQSPGTVHFTNTSNGPGTLSYSWNFGDGTSSTQTAPTHTYTKNGLFTVTLTMTNELGCVAMSSQQDLIRVGGFTTAFQEPALMCENTSFTLTNTSSPTPQESEWYVNGNLVLFDYYNSGLPLYNYPPGDYTVELHTRYGPCNGNFSKKITVKAAPDVQPFEVDIKGLCGAPVQVNFRDVTPGAVAWNWSFQSYTYGESSLQAPSHTYTADGYYPVYLDVTNAAGCHAYTSRSVPISKPLISIVPDYNSPMQACDSLPVSLKYSSTEALTSVKWDFGDGTTSTLENPTHTYTKPGFYSVSLTYTTLNGCKGIATSNNTFVVREKPKANFSSPQDICGNTPVLFNPFLTTGYHTSFVWDFGDNTYGQWDNHQHKYETEGTYDVTLIAYNNYCSDTITKPAYIRVKPPFPKVGIPTNTCDGNRGLVQIEDNSRQASSWKWTFGDGTSTSYTTTQPTVSHEYASTGTYKIVLATTNGSCTVKDSIEVKVLRKKEPKLALTVANSCGTSSRVNFTVSGLDPNPYSQSYYSYHYQYTMFDESGSIVSFYNPNYNYGTLPLTGQMDGLPPGNYKVRIVTTSYGFNCSDTTAYVSFTIGGPTAGIKLLSQGNCFKGLVRLQDQSIGGNNVALKAINWSFGDGTSMNSVPGATVEHRYAGPGTYYVALHATDDKGCDAITTTMVSVTGPQASFQMNPASPVQLNSTVQFYNYTNTTNAPNTTYQWQIGSLATSADYSPSYTFPVEGSYPITLIANNPDNGCADTMKQILVVKEFKTGFSTNESFIGDHGTCAPVLAHFSNRSTNYTRLVWDFGDGQTLEDVYSPAHIYSLPGTYFVKLEIYGYNGLEETQYDTVYVTRPAGVIDVPVLEACLGVNLELNAPSTTGIGAYHWDFGNGYMTQTNDSLAVHAFNEPGTYQPALVIRDAAGCETAIKGTAVTIHPDPIVNINPDAAVICKGQAVQLTATGGDQYAWSPSAGLNTSVSSTVTALPVIPTQYHVDVTDLHGCKGMQEIMVEVATPFHLTGTNESDLCKGSSLQLNMAGIPDIRWIGNTTGLSNPSISSPVASPLSDITYTAVGYDRYQCYSDTHQVKINVRPLPTVNAGNDLEVVFGSENPLAATGSSDVIRWKWSPSDFLTCVNCQHTMSRPFSDILYVLQGTTAYGCFSKDSIFIKATCSEGTVFIPTAFTPNNDGKNDRFMILGSGVSRVKAFRVFNRWGNVLVDRKNFLPGDISASWDGRYQGLEAESGVYIYVAELECGPGEIYTRKGTITLIR